MSNQYRHDFLQLTSLLFVVYTTQPYEFIILLYYKVDECNYSNDQQDATVYVNLLFLDSSTCFSQYFRSS
jgi:hypothetical protein